MHCNVHEAEQLGLRVAHLGAYPVIPHANTRNFDKQLTDKFWLDGTVELMKRCDGLLTTPRWEESSGANDEVRIMKEMFKPVFHALADLKDYLAYEGFTARMAEVRKPSSQA